MAGPIIMLRFESWLSGSGDKTLQNIAVKSPLQGISVSILRGRVMMYRTTYPSQLKRVRLLNLGRSHV